MRTRFNLPLTVWGFVPLAVLLALAIASPAALGASLWVTAETIEAVESDGFVDLQLSLTVTNEEALPFSDVYVVFEDGLEVSMGDVASGESAQSAPVLRTVDTSQSPSINFPVPVTLTFFLDGVFEELPATVVMQLAAPGE